MRDLNTTENSTHSNDAAEAKFRDSIDAKWTYRAGHIEADNDEEEEEEWGSPQVAMKKEPEREPEVAKEEEDTAPKDPTELSLENCLLAFKDIASSSGFDISGDDDDMKKKSPRLSNLSPKDSARKTLLRRSGRKQSRTTQRSSIMESLKNLDV